MRVLVTGASGFIGSALVPFLAEGGHAVTRLIRAQPRPGQAEVHWDPVAGKLDPMVLQGVDAAVHLAGESIAQRWTPERKARILKSRARGTRLLSESFARLTQPPRVLLCASAIGYYGDRGEEILNEGSPSGVGFLAQVCREWEAACEPAVRKGIRVVNLRIGVVLSSRGGALARMLFPFRLGLGARIGSGRQYMSWVAIDDLLRAILHALIHGTLAGPVNAVAPNPVTNLEFTRTLGRVLGRPAVLRLPGFVARLALGEMANSLLLASARVEPARLMASGYSFCYPELEGALRRVLGE
jgi:uncharacterized protein (TIGR01777 family)